MYDDRERKKYWFNYLNPQSLYESNTNLPYKSALRNILLVTYTFLYHVCHFFSCIFIM